MSRDTTDRLSVLANELADVLEKAVEEALPLVEQEETDLRDLEQATGAAMKRVERRFLELLVEACRPDEAEEGVPCRCGGRAEFERHREGRVITTFDQIEFTRAYYLCPECHEGTHPLDERLGAMCRRAQCGSPGDAGSDRHPRPL